MTRRENSFETGLADGTLITNANSDDGTPSAGNALGVTGGSFISYTDANPMRGLQSAKIDLVTSTISTHLRMGVGATGTLSVRCYIRFVGSMPTANITCVMVRTAATTQAAALRVTAAGLPAFLNTGTTALFTGSTPLVADTWYRVEFWVTVGTTSTDGRFGGAVYLGHSMTPIAEYQNLATNVTTSMPTQIEAGRGSGADVNVVLQYDDLATEDAIGETFLGPSEIPAPVVHDVSGTVAVTTDAVGAVDQIVAPVVHDVAGVIGVGTAVAGALSLNARVSGVVAVVTTTSGAATVPSGTVHVITAVAWDYSLLAGG